MCYRFSYPITALSGIKNIKCQTYATLLIKSVTLIQMYAIEDSIAALRRLVWELNCSTLNKKFFNSVNHNSKAPHSIQNDFGTKHVHAWLSNTSSAFKSRSINRTIALVAAAIFCAVIATKFCCPNCTSVACLSSVPWLRTCSRASAIWRLNDAFHIEKAFSNTTHSPLWRRPVWSPAAAAAACNHPLNLSCVVQPWKKSE